MNAQEILSQSRLFRDFNEKQRAQLAAISTVSTHSGGSTLVKQGSEDRNISILGSGSARVVKSAKDKIEEVARFGAGSVLGEMAFMDAEPRSTSVEAVEQVSLLSLPYEKLLDLFQQDQEFAARFYQAVAALLTRRLRGATDDVVTLRAVLKRH